MNKLCVFLCLLPAVLGAHVDLSTYPLSQVLRDEGGETYTLHWAFNVEEETIRFAVNVSTLGWVGFGLSPTGGMANSDVVIGWVNDNGQAFLDDRFATGEIQPPVDAQQNWSLDGGEEDNGYTILAFRRDWVTCDEFDRDIQVETARVIFSWNEADPVNDDPENVLYHGVSRRGAVSINLLGAQQEVPPDPADAQTFGTVVNNINIPAVETTYWCSVFEIPAQVQAQTHYITKITPVITEGNEAYVHHILVYECYQLNNTHVGESGVCSGEVSNEVSGCRGGTLVAGWAVGGTDYYFPADVAYPFGGGGPRFFVMETHYDNLNMSSDIFDSSGMEYTYTATARLYDSAFLGVGHTVSTAHVIPAGAKVFNTFGECNSECTNKYFPEEGITVFSNLLHTHLAGVGVTLHHYRRVSNSQGCSALDELEPIEQNLQYDFNYQEYTILTTPIKVMPGDILQLECNYNTENRTHTTLGGPATSDEMCLSFLAYYPRTNLGNCISSPNVSSFADFARKYLTLVEQFSLGTADRERQAQQNAWNSVSWTPEKIAGFEETINSGVIYDLCIPFDARTSENIDFIPKVGLSEADCEYQGPDQCTGFQPVDCCTRLGFGGAPVISASAALITLCLVTMLALLQ